MWTMTFLAARAKVSRAPERERRRSAGVALLAAFLLTALVPGRGFAVSCSTTALAYSETGNLSQSSPLCPANGVTCNFPVLGAPAYSVAPGCNPVTTSCGMTATLSAQFPANHQNDPAASGFAFSYANVELYTLYGRDMQAHLLDRDPSLWRDYGENQRLYEDTHHGLVCSIFGGWCGAD